MNRFVAVTGVGWLLGCVWISGCSSDSADTPPPSSPTGGVSATGGAPGAGSPATGGTIAAPTGGQGTGGAVVAATGGAAPATGGAPPTGGAPAATGGTVAASGAGGTSGGVSGGTGGALGGAAPGGGAGTAGAAGASGGGGGSGPVSAKSFTCNVLLGIDSTSEWFGGGFENQVENGRWEIIYYHPGFVEDWANPSDMVYSLAPTSACTMNADNPDRAIFNVFADPADSAFNNKDAWVMGLTKSIANLTKKWTRLKRIDLLTMTRAPNNTPCDSSNRMSIVETWVDEAVAAVGAANPNLVVVSPKFFAPNCNVFTDGGPHFNDAGKMTIAKLYGDYYSAEP